MLRRLKPLHFIWILLLLETLESTAHAKSVTIEWKSIEGASSYELQIQRGDQIVSKKSTKDSEWKGELPPGVYTYQIRAVDQGNHPGAWSALQALAVMPPAPKLTQPQDGAKIGFFRTPPDFTLSWEPIPGIHHYNVELVKDGKVIATNQITGEPKLKISSPQPGKYNWSVKAVLQPTGRVPASLLKKKWESDASDKQEFIIEYKQLGVPVLEFPKGVLSPPEGMTQFKWGAVEGAEVYEIQMIRLSSSYRGRALASQFGAAKRFYVKKPSFETKLPSQGEFAWKVRALAQLFPKGNSPPIMGAESVEKFQYDPNLIFKDDLGYFAFSTLAAPYTYRIISPSANFQGTAASTGLAFRLSGEYWFVPQWGISLGAEYFAFQVAKQSLSRFSGDLTAKYRMNLGQSNNGWSISPRLGIEARSYMQIIPTLKTDGSFSGLNTSFLLPLGGLVGIDIRKQFSAKWSAGLKLTYFCPLTFVSGPSGSKVTSEASYRNFSAGLQGLYWFSPNFGVGAGGYFDLRSISYSTGSSTAAEQVYTDGIYFFGSLVYRLWR